MMENNFDLVPLLEAKIQVAKENGCIEISMHLTELLKYVMIN